MKKTQEKLEKQQVKKVKKGGEKRQRIKAANQQTLNQPAEVTKSRTANVGVHRPK